MLQEAPIVQMLKRKVRDEVKQEVKKDLQPFVLMPTYVYLVVAVVGLIVSIWREWSIAVSIISVLCLVADTFLQNKSIVGHSVSTGIQDKDGSEVVVDMESNIQEKQ